MAIKGRQFDVWIVETNTVYRQVPFSVVTDWAEQGRLLGEDRVRASGTEKWQSLGEVSSFAAYLAKEEPFRAEDKAEALEPVQLDFGWKKSRSDEDDDVDMIPLIDVSLVLLIFFMMTAAVGGVASAINIPEAEHKLGVLDPKMLWIGVDRDPKGKPAYFLGEGDSGPGVPYASQAEMLAAFAQKLNQEGGEVNVRVRADRRLPCEIIIQELGVALEKFKRRGTVKNVYTEVSEKKIP